MKIPYGLSKLSLHISYSWSSQHRLHCRSTCVELIMCSMINTQLHSRALRQLAFVGLEKNNKAMFLWKTLYFHCTLWFITFNTHNFGITSVCLLSMRMKENTRRIVFLLHVIKKYNRQNKPREKYTFNNVILLLMLFVYLFICFWCDSPHLDRFSSLSRFLDHTQRRKTAGRTLLEE